MFWKQLRDAAGTFFNLGVGGAGLRSQSGRVEARNAANDGFAPVVAEQLRLGATDSPWLRKLPSVDALQLFAGASDGSGLADGTINVGAIAAFGPASATVLRLYYGLGFDFRSLSIGASPPASPQVGDRWVEINVSTGASLYGWWWEWSGVYWLSPDMRRSYPVFNASPGSLSSLYFHAEQTLDTFIKSVEYNVLVSTTNNGSNFWAFQLARANASNANTNIGSSVNTSAATAGNWSTQRITLNTHIDVSAVGMRQLLVILGNTGSPGALFGTAEIVFNYARP